MPLRQLTTGIHFTARHTSRLAVHQGAERHGGQWHSGQVHPTYRQRLTPPWWVWVLASLVCLSLAVAYGAVFGMVIGTITFVLLAALAGWLLWRTSPIIEVNDTGLRAGKAFIEFRYIGLVATLDFAAMRHAGQSGADPRAYRLVRGLSAKEGVSIEVVDDEDPHPYWLISTDRPTELSAAIAEGAKRSASIAARQ